MSSLTSNEIEAANRAEATALLIRAGLRVYRPEADCYGEDLIVRDHDGQLHAVQLKSRPTVNPRKYGGMTGYGCYSQKKDIRTAVRESGFLYRMENCTHG
jgi:hypothetical protein